MDPRLFPLIIGCVLGSALSIVWFQDAPPTLALQPAPICTALLDQPDLRGTAAYVLDVSSGAVLYEKNASTQLPLASLTKLMTVLTAVQSLTPNATVSITQDSLTPEGESGLVIGEEWRAGDLGSFTLMESSNDGARALLLASVAALNTTENKYIDVMNRRARALGLGATFFLNETGLDVSSTTAGAYGSARDVALLLKYIVLNEPALAERSVTTTWTFRSLSGKIHAAENTSLLAASLASSVVSKTGYTDLAGGNLAFEFEPVPGHPVIVVVLGSTRDGRTTDAAALVDYTTTYLKRSLLCQPTYD